MNFELAYTYQFNTRDTFGFALKSTFVKIKGVEQKIFKDPITDGGSFKKSQFGMVCVLSGDGTYHYVDELSMNERDSLSSKDHLKDLFIDGKLVRDDSFSEIRKRLLSNL